MYRADEEYKYSNQLCGESVKLTSALTGHDHSEPQVVGYAFAGELGSSENRV